MKINNHILKSQFIHAKHGSVLWLNCAFFISVLFLWGLSHPALASQITFKNEIAPMEGLQYQRYLELSNNDDFLSTKSDLTYRNYLLGQRARAQNDYAYAASMLESAFDAKILAEINSPTAQSALFDLGLMHLHAGSFDEALYVFRYLKNTRFERWVSLVEASAALAEKDYKKSLKASQDFAKTPDILSLFNIVLTANAQIALKNWDEAEKTVKGYSKTLVTDQVINAHLAAINYFKGDYDQALRQLTPVIDDDFIMKAPGLQFSIYLNLLSAKNQPDMIRQALLKRITANPKNDLMIYYNEFLAKQPSDEELLLPALEIESFTAQMILALAEAMQERLFQSVLGFYRLALWVNPDENRVKRALAEYFLDEDNYDIAQNYLTDIKNDKRYEYRANILMARIEMLKGNHNASYELLEALSQSYPNYLEPLFQMGLYYRIEKNYEEAIKVYQRALQRLPNLENSEFDGWHIYHYMAVSHDNLGNWDQAEAYFLKALDYIPSQYQTANYLGYSWIDKGINLNKGQKLIEVAARLQPGAGYIIDSLGWMHYRLGNFDKAVDELERAIQLMPGDPIVNDHLGDVYWQVGREREAIYQWQRALYFGADEKLTATIQAKIENGL